MFGDLMLPNIAIYGSHNSSFAVEHNGKIVEVLELERFFNLKNIGYGAWRKPKSVQYTTELVLNYFKEKYGYTEYDNCLYQYCSEYLQYIPAKKYIETLHHVSHSAGCFYQSTFDEALVISFDGGGNDGFFKIFLANRKTGVSEIFNVDLDLGSSYMYLGHYFSDIKLEDDYVAPVVYAGKILGLQSYGESRKEWEPSFRKYYFTKNYELAASILSKEIGVEFNKSSRLTGKLEYDVAATLQKVFEDITFEYIDEFVTKYSDLPICLTGGCALNIVLNTKVRQKYNRTVFVGPNPNDCGLAIGMLANLIKPVTPIDVTYLGPEPLDKNILPRLIETYGAKKVSISELAKDIVDGKIIGIVQGRSEHGPRALGNRSIICNPLIKDMKDKLNSKVKHREWYRPFAPIVRLEDVSEYFEWNEESRWMSFCVDVKEQYRNIIPAVVHIDNTARVQTVTYNQNPMMYNLLTEFKNITGIGVLLNTSFNVDGKPILSTYTDALTVLGSTELDAVYMDNFYFIK